MKDLDRMKKNIQRKGSSKEMVNVKQYKCGTVVKGNCSMRISLYFYISLDKKCNYACLI